VLVTHDLGVVARTANDLLVMYAGRAVEYGPMREVLRSPFHPYTTGLVGSAPRLDGPRGPLPTIPGQPPDGTERATGCPFAPRCALRASRCDTPPPLLRVPYAPHRGSACHEVHTLIAGGVE
jgi:peptide/nickel transport system ATP-binding protein